MPQECLELCDGVDAAPNPSTGTGPMFFLLSTHYLFGHCQRGRGVISLSFPLPDMAFLLSPMQV